MEEIKIGDIYTEKQLDELGLVNLGVPTDDNKVFGNATIYERNTGGESYLISCIGPNKYKVEDKLR